MGAIANDWLAPLKPEFAKPYYAKLYKTVLEEYKTHQVFPPADQIFHAFEATPLADVKVVILGQDPYHGPGQANGLCFSVSQAADIPPSLLRRIPTAESAGREFTDAAIRILDQAGPAHRIHAMGKTGTGQREAC